MFRDCGNPRVSGAQGAWVESVWRGGGHWPAHSVPVCQSASGLHFEVPGIYGSSAFQKWQEGQAEQRAGLGNQGRAETEGGRKPKMASIAFQPGPPPGGTKGTLVFPEEF